MFLPIKDPPHQNSVLLGPCRKIAASQGHSPLCASTPPTIRPDEYSCWPQSFGSTKLPSSSSDAGFETAFGGDCVIVETVKTGTKGRRVVVDAVVDIVTGFRNKLGRVVNFRGR